MPPMYTLPIMPRSKKRRLAGPTASLPPFPLHNPIGNVDSQSDFSWYKDPNTGRITDVSNDENINYNQAQESLPPEKPIVRTQSASPYFPVTYSCEHVIESRGGENDPSTPMLHEMSIPIIVEALIPSPIQDIEGNIHALQWSFLNAVADHFGLIDACDLDLQDGSHRTLRHLQISRRLQVSKLPYSTTVYKVASNPSTNWTGN
jgi:hypothetical protein